MEIPEYVKNGFRSDMQYKLWKSKNAADKSERVLKESRKNRNLRFLIQQIYAKKLTRQDLRDEILIEICKGFKSNHYSRKFLDTLLYLEANSKLLENIFHVRGIISLVTFNLYWIRSIKDWKPGTHNAGRQFSSLSRYLLAKYKVPVFMDSAWFHNNEREQKWFMHIGSGRNIRTAPDLPFPLTKKMAHHFMEAPDLYSINEALRWGQVHALNGNQRLTDAFRETRLFTEFRDNEFELSVIRFFVDNPMLDTVHIAPMIDYIWNQKFDGQQVFVARGVAENRGPVQPNFSMNSRTPESLLCQVEAWHRRLGKETKSENLQWERSNIRDFEFQTGSKKTGNLKIWRIKELLDSRELIAEGRAMKHCIASYAHSCARRRCAIFTMEFENEGGLEKLLTIEVQLGNRQIGQVRGKFNRYATQKELNILKRWALRERLMIASYV
jgi:hypothetical protein